MDLKIKTSHSWHARTLYLYLYVRTQKNIQLQASNVSKQQIFNPQTRQTTSYHLIKPKVAMSNCLGYGREIVERDDILSATALIDKMNSSVQTCFGGRDTRQNCLRCPSKNRWRTRRSMLAFLAQGHGSPRFDFLDDTEVNVLKSSAMDSFTLRFGKRRGIVCVSVFLCVHCYLYIRCWHRIEKS